MALAAGNTNNNQQYCKNATDGDGKGTFRFRGYHTGSFDNQQRKVYKYYKNIKTKIEDEGKLKGIE